MNARLSIGLVARQTGCTVPTIRYYEEIGLLPPAHRTNAGQRHYDERTIRRLTFIRRCRDFGFSIDQVRELVGLVDQPGRPCNEVRDIAALHLAQLPRRADGTGSKPQCLRLQLRIGMRGRACHRLHDPRRPGGGACRRCLGDGRQLLRALALMTT